MAVHAGTETEIKLLANGPLSDDEVIRSVRGLEGFEFDEPDRVEQRDVYLDDSNLHLARQGIGLRVRTTPDGRILCWKRRGKVERDAHTRDEIEHEWRRADPPAHAGDLRRPMRTLIEPFVYRRELAPIIRLHTDRTRVRLRFGETRAELCIDRVAAQPPDGALRHEFTEVEIELIEGQLGPLQELARVLRSEFGVTSSRTDKLARALRLCERDPARPERVSRLGTPARITCQLYLERHFERMQRAELDSRLDLSARAVHRLRVSCRRLRSCILAFEPYLTEELTGPIHKMIARTGRAAGNVRDLDVLRSALADGIRRLPAELHEGAAIALDHLLAERRKRHAKMIEKLRHKRRLKTLEDFQTLLDAPLSNRLTTRAQTKTIAQQTISAAAQDLSTIAASGELHPTRLALKRLRYTCEVFQEAYGDKLTQFAQELGQLQNALGEANDAQNAERILLAWSSAYANRLPAAALVATGAWIEQQRARSTAAAAEFAERLREFDHAALESRLREALHAR